MLSFEDMSIYRLFLQATTRKDPAKLSMHAWLLRSAQGTGRARSVNLAPFPIFENPDVIKVLSRFFVLVCELYGSPPKY
jgi:hypothetical protein